MVRSLVVTCCLLLSLSACGGGENNSPEEGANKPVEVSSSSGEIDGRRAYLIDAKSWVADNDQTHFGMIELLQPIKLEYMRKQIGVIERGEEALPVHFSIYVNDGLKVSAWLNADYSIDPSGLFMEEFYHNIEFTEVAPNYLRELSAVCLTINEPPIPACKPYMLK